MSEIQKRFENRKEIDGLYRKYKSYLLQFVSASVTDKSVAEDIVQDTFYEAVRRYEEVFRDHPNQVGWLYQTAKFKIMEFHRKLNKMDELDLVEVSEQRIVDETGFAEVEMELLLYEQLSPDELLRFRRYYLWGDTAAELAEKEGTTENNIRVKLSRLRHKVKRIMSQE